MPFNPPAHKSCTAGQSVVREQFDRPMPQTLGDVITSIQESEERLSKRKMTFEEWWDWYYPPSERADPSYVDASLVACWKAAQENV